MRNGFGTARAAHSRREGFSLVELIVAIVILAVGVLALAAGSTLVVRMLGGGARQSSAATVAATRLETLRSSPCAQIGAGDVEYDGIREQWTSVDIVRGAAVIAKDVRLTLTYTVSGTHRGGAVTRSKTYRSFVPCTSL